MPARLTLLMRRCILRNLRSCAFLTAHVFFLRAIFPPSQFLFHIWQQKFTWAERMYSVKDREREKEKEKRTHAILDPDAKDASPPWKKTRSVVAPRARCSFGLAIASELISRQPSARTQKMRQSALPRGHKRRRG